MAQQSNDKNETAEVKIINFCESIKKEDFLDTHFIENNFILELGLNNEFLEEQPKEFYDFYGKGLGCRIWQYPNQFSKYLRFILDFSSKINSYLEIGCRFGGTYIAHTEFLKKQNKNFSKSIALDIIDCPDLLKSYIAINKQCEFKKLDSISEDFKRLMNENYFDLIFIDGNHSYEYIKNDFESTIEKCNIQVFHDICSDACPAVNKAWVEAKRDCSKTHKAYEFTDQYFSVPKKYLGIGVLVRNNWVNVP